MSTESQVIDASRGHVDPIDMMSERVESCFENRLDASQYGCRLVERQLSAIMTAVNSAKSVVVTNCTARKRGALEHLAMTPSRLVATDLETDEARDSVYSAMANLRRRTIATRTKGTDTDTDTEIIELLRANWQAFNGESSRLLRYLRDIAGVACVQDRFKKLWHQVRDSS